MKGKRQLQEFSIYAEYKPKLSAVQAYITLNDIRHEKLLLRVKKDGSLTIGNKSHCVSLNLEGINVLPASCQGLQFSGKNLLQFRLNAHGSTRTASDASSKQINLVERCTDQNVRLSCTHCQYELMTPHRFKRVLPLPSDNWLGGCGEWFCHGEPDGATSGALSVRPSDCLIGDTCVMLASSLQQLHVLKQSESKRVKCKRCHSELGTIQKVEKQGNGLYKVEENLRLSLHSVCLSPGDAPVEVNCPVTALCSLLLRYSADLNVFRFLVEVQGKPKLLLWLLEKECIVYRGSHTDTTLQPQPAVKLLYLDGLREKNKKMCEQWNTDLTVHNISLPSTSFLQVLQALIDSTRILPTKSLNGFNMGFLNRS